MVSCAILILTNCSQIKKNSDLGEETDCKEAQGSFGNDGNVLYHDCANAYTTVHICQNTSNCILKTDDFYYM